MPSPESPIFLQSGPLTIRWYGLLLVGAVVAGLVVARWEASRRQEHLEHVTNLLVWCLIIGLIGARLYHVVSSPAGASQGFSTYFGEQAFARLMLFGIPVLIPTALLVWQGGLGLFGALFGGIAGLLIYCRRHQLDPWRWLDIASPALLLGQTIGRWGNFFNQELYGFPTQLPWGITITNVNQRLAPYNDLTAYPLETTFHPVFLYESFWTLVGFGWWLGPGRKITKQWPPGWLFGAYLMWYGLGRFGTEALRPDAWLIGGVAVAQVLSVLCLAAGLAIWRQRRRGPLAPANLDNEPV